jgi:hypothetical protein
MNDHCQYVHVCRLKIDQCLAYYGGVHKLNTDSAKAQMRCDFGAIL